MKTPASKLATFRVHFHDDVAIDITATDPTIAEARAKKQRPGNFVKKIKILRDSSNLVAKDADHG